ncbi:MAG: adenosylmethionine--8-amino-7-oxononanoate transaminase [Alphaproteobacteria bacterium]|nr:adenosylmethionine--8-amino-7-oxononanoate transaminase [Alphaproteobacteria bacterium]
MKALATAADAPGWFEAGLAHIWLPYTQMGVEEPPLAVRRTDGVHIHLADGRELIDGMASWWTACHGYNHPHMVAAMTDQARVMPHVMFGGLVHEGALRLARRLAAITPGDLDRVFFSDSGSVAVEVALKMALQYWVNAGEAGRTRFVCFQGGYHGDTFGAMGVSDSEQGFGSTFRGALATQITTALPRDRAAGAEFETLLEARRGEIAAVIVEPLVQGAGGMVFHDADTLARVAAAAKKRGIPVIADEIFTGFGRTGRMFACQAAELVPDIMCLSKALTGGAVGLGATIARPHIFDAFLGDDLARAFMHGPTYMANPVACAAANASLDLFDTEPRLDQAARMEARLEAGLAPLRTIDGVVGVRAMGAIGVVELDQLPLPLLTRLRRRFIDRGLWVRPFGRVVYLTPALVMEEGDIDRLCAGIGEVLQGI